MKKTVRTSLKRIISIFLGLKHLPENDAYSSYLSVMQLSTANAGSRNYITNFDKMSLMAKWGD
jgi:hypothetical protein